MAYRVILIESDNIQSGRLAGVINDAEGCELVSTFNKISAALGQSSVFQPDLFLVDVDNRENLSAISAFIDIFPEAVLLCMMEHWDENVADQCVQMGAMGCMIKPIRGEELTEALNIFHRRGHFKSAKIMAFFSPKGHSGKTTIIANLALSLARETGESVGIIDADLQFGDMPVFFDIEPKSTIVEAARDISLLSPITLSPYFFNLTDGLYMLSSPKRTELAELVDQESLIKIVRMTGHLYRYVLIDLPCGVSPLVMGICELADTIFLSGMMGNGFEVKHMQRALGMFQGWSDYGKNVNVVFSRVDPYNEAEQQKLSQKLQYPISAILPNEYLLISAANSGKMPEAIDLNSSITKKFDSMARELMK